MRRGCWWSSRRACRTDACAICRTCSSRATCWCSTTPGCCRPGWSAGAARARSRSPCTPREQGGRWRAFARPARRCRPGDRLMFAPDFSAEVLAQGRGRRDHAAASRATRRGLIARLEAHGAMPLPPYIKRPRGGDPRDRDDYQTLFARRAGAVAAPTAALHFTAPLMAALARRGIEHTFVTLHVGAGTFLPVRTEDCRGPCDACRVVRGAGRDGRAGRARAGERRARGRGRHHGAAHARERRGRRRHAARRAPARPGCSSRRATASRWSTAC